ncbi:MAG: hypothetical protein ABSG98_11260 [Anaerolineales bacterium]|jgi:hypothetical protein
MPEAPITTRELAKFYIGRPHVTDVAIDHISRDGRYVVFSLFPKGRPTLFKLMLREELLRYFGNLHEGGAP